jgi:hypothetical protein
MAFNTALVLGIRREQLAAVDDTAESAEIAAGLV